MVNNDSKLCGNTLGLLLIFGISIGIGYLIYSSKQTKNDVDNTYNINTLNNKNEIKNKINEVSNLIVNSDTVIREFEKFNDLQKIINTNNVTGDFKLDTDIYNHNEYNNYFIKNPIKCISNKINTISEQQNTKSEQNMLDYDDTLKNYVESINLDLIQFLQKSYKDAHHMNIERQLNMNDIDNLPGKFM